jgi:hypothetical protein
MDNIKIIISSLLYNYTCRISTALSILIAIFLANIHEWSFYLRINVRYSLREYRGPNLIISNENLKIVVNHILTIYFFQKGMLHVAIRGIWLRCLANERIPVPAILHRQFPCLLRHTFLAHDFLGVRQIRGGLFRPNLYTNGLSWQTISW